MPARATEKERIALLYEKAVDAALSLLEEEVQKVLDNNPRRYHYFRMGNGTAIFVTFPFGGNRDGSVLGLDDDEQFLPIRDILDEWDDYLHLTGVPLDMTRTSRHITINQESNL